VELQDHYATFREAGAELVALVVASLESVEGWCQRSGYTYPVLADSAHEVAEAYGVYDLLDDGLAAPAAFVIDVDGRIVWSQVSEDAYEWPAAEIILDHLP
jgi:peroxiredoxin